MLYFDTPPEYSEAYLRTERYMSNPMISSFLRIVPQDNSSTNGNITQLGGLAMFFLIVVLIFYFLFCAKRIFYFSPRVA
jgi:hypothetical protein